MNANTYNQTSNNSSPSTSPISPFTCLVLQLPSPIYNPTNADFERLSQQYAQIFFYILEQKLQPKITNLKYTIEKSLLHSTLTTEFTQHIM